MFSLFVSLHAWHGNVYNGSARFHDFNEGNFSVDSVYCGYGFVQKYRILARKPLIVHRKKTIFEQTVSFYIFDNPSVDEKIPFTDNRREKTRN